MDLDIEKALANGLTNKQIGSSTISYIKFSKINLNKLSISALESIFKQKISFPAHLQISFFADFLEKYSFSSE